MSESGVQGLFRRAVAHSDAESMQEGLERLLGLAGRGLDAEAEFELRRDDFVMEMPQSGERIRGREAMREMQKAFPTPPSSMTFTQGRRGRAGVGG